ncbi:MAG: mannitol dehydrogenase family protein [Oscillospiraceae bacterium]|jgi:fructuronate reductase|nr:mannitol dehydrogenase family protein [Oscillospiraceae bacterium]
MKLSDKGLQKRKKWEAKRYVLPEYDRLAIREKTKNEPTWLHFGAGNISRAYIAVLAQRLLDEGLIDKGLIMAEGYDYEIIDDVYTPFDDLSIAVTLMPDGTKEKTVVGSVVESIKMDDDGEKRLCEIFSANSLQMVSLTITEKGYDVNISDLTNGPNKSEAFLGKLAALCYHRYLNGAYPISIVSMDNCSHNGNVLYNAIRRYVVKWIDRGFVDGNFLEYIDNPNLVYFPSTMIDKITPYPDESVYNTLTDDGVKNMKGIVTEKNSFVAPYVNTESPEYLVVEDKFPNGRPPLEKVGVIFTDLETVDKVEKMKVCTCLNPLHTALAIFACMLSYTRISDAMRDEDLLRLVKRVAEEGLPVVVDPGIISPSEFITTVIDVRFPNPFIPDTPQRIVTDTSKKLAVRFGETIKAYIAKDALDITTLRAIPLVFAGWCRYLLGVDDNGEPYELEPDPMLYEIVPLLEDVKLGSSVDVSEILKPILSNADIFGVDLYEVNLGNTVIEYFELLIKGTGAVRDTLRG